MVAQVIAHGDAEGLASQFFGDGDVEGFRGRVGIDTVREGGCFSEPRAALALRGGGHIAFETGHARGDDFVAIGLEDLIANPAADHGEHRVERNEGHCGAVLRAAGLGSGF